MAEQFVTWFLGVVIGMAGAIIIYYTVIKEIK